MSSKPPTVSIICPTYNQEKFIAQTLDGFVMQKTTFPFEIIVHDDASTDKTAEIVRKYEAEYPELFANIYQTENQFSKAIGNISRITFAAAHGRYLALCEGDDYWTDPLKLQKQVDFLEANPDFAICFHPVEVIYEDGSRKSYLSNPDQKEVTTFEDLVNGNYIHTLSCLFRNNLFGKFPEWIATSPIGDYPLHLLNAQHGKIKFLKDVMGVYRINAGSIWGRLQQRQASAVTNTVLENCYKHFYPRGKKQFKQTLGVSYKNLAFCEFDDGNYKLFRNYYLKLFRFLKEISFRNFFALTVRFFLSFVPPAADLYKKNVRQ